MNKLETYPSYSKQNKTKQKIKPKIMDKIYPKQHNDMTADSTERDMGITVQTVDCASESSKSGSDSSSRE